MTKELSERINELKLLREGHRATISNARNILNNNLHFENKRKWLEVRVALYQKELGALLYEREHGDETIVEHLQRVEELNTEIKLLKHQKKIEKLLALQKEINEAKENDE